MSTENFHDLLKSQWAQEKFVCVRLGIDPKTLPPTIPMKSPRPYDKITRIDYGLIQRTYEIVCAYIINPAIYNTYGNEGWQALRQTISLIRHKKPRVPIIIDAQWNDTACKNEYHVRTAFHVLDADATTVSPYLGSRALKPFLQEAEKGIFIICKTFGDDEIQRLSVQGRPLYQNIAQLVADKWNFHNNCGVSMATDSTSELKEVRSILNEMPMILSIHDDDISAETITQLVQVGCATNTQGIILDPNHDIINSTSQEDYATIEYERIRMLNSLVVNALTEIN